MFRGDGTLMCIKIHWLKHRLYHFSNEIYPTNDPQEDNNGTEPRIRTNTHVYENEKFNALQHEISGASDRATYVTHPSHLQYDNLPPQQHVYECVN